MKDLTIEQFMYLTLLSKAFKDNPEKLDAEIVKYLHGDLELTKKGADDLLVSVYQLLSEVPDMVNRFTHNGVEYGFIPNLDKIEFGAFCDLETYMKFEDKPLHKIAAILYRPITKQVGQYYKVEKYKGSDKYANIMKGVSYRVVLGALQFFLRFKDEFVKRYRYVYKQRDPDGDDQELTLDQKFLVSEKEEFAEEFGWQPMFDAIGQNQFKSTDQVTRMPADEALHILNYITRKNELNEKDLRSRTKIK